MYGVVEVSAYFHYDCALHCVERHATQRAAVMKTGLKINSSMKNRPT